MILTPTIVGQGFEYDARLPIWLNFAARIGIFATMEAPFSPLVIANYFVSKAQQSDYVVTPMKLVKLVYVAHGWYLALKGKPLISENIEAWKYGPVVRSVYAQFKSYGNHMIDKPAPYPIPPSDLDFETQKFLNKIWDVYGKLTGTQLSALTHQPGTPWDRVWNQLNGRNATSAIITDDIIREHYESKSGKTATSI